MYKKQNSKAQKLKSYSLNKEKCVYSCVWLCIFVVYVAYLTFILFGFFAEVFDYVSIYIIFLSFLHLTWKII